MLVAWSIRGLAAPYALTGAGGSAGLRMSLPAREGASTAVRVGRIGFVTAARAIRFPGKVALEREKAPEKADAPSPWGGRFGASGLSILASGAGSCCEV
ncbi:hypothetical protein GCM10009754_26360 [Amycolatopsis minnesotensis]|uniref:Uncharacterized protein n=1 Tax=Amycolatopsis minnesotensis TaxID=337894 RepID=A0ABN2QN45_9PSEU